MENSENLYKNNQRLIYYFLNTYYPAYVDDDDYVQECRIALWKASETYANHNTSTFAVWAMWMMKTQVRAYYRKDKRWNNHDSTDGMDLDVWAGDTYCLELRDGVCSQIESKESMCEILSHLNDEDKKICVLLSQDKTQRQIADVMGVHETTISQHKSRIRKRLQMAGYGCSA